MIEWLSQIDRRIIFVLVFLSLIFPRFFTVDLPISSSKEVNDAFSAMDKLPEGSPILIAFDFGPSSKPELEPMAKAVLHHAFKKNLRVSGLTLWPDGRDLAKMIMVEIAEKYKKEEGKDWTFLGYAAGRYAVIINMGEDLYSASPTDSRGVSTKDIPALKGVRSLKDFKFVFTLAAGESGEWWIIYGKEKYGFPLAEGCTAVMAPDLYPYLQSKQIVGLLGGIKGAWEYEFLVKEKGKAYEVMAAQSSVHALVVFLILICNFAFFLSLRRRKG